MDWHCSENVGVAFTPAPREGGALRVTAIADGRSATCEVALPAKFSEQAPYPAVTCDGKGLEPWFRSDALAGLTLSGTPAQLHLHVEQGGHVLFDGSPVVEKETQSILGPRRCSRLSGNVRLLVPTRTRPQPG
jgi:hypothetical protein